LEGNTTFTIGATIVSPTLKAHGQPTDLFGGTVSGGDFNPAAALTGPFNGKS